MRTVFVSFILILIGPLPSGKAQTARLGSGVFINPMGYVLTNRHVVEGGCAQLYVETLEGRRIASRVYRMSDTDDLALVETGVTTKSFAFLRMNESYEAGMPPLRGESVHILGFPDGEFGPRGGFVKFPNDPRHGSRGFTIGLNTTYGASGGPVFDDDGLLVGLIWGGIDYIPGSDRPLVAYAIDSEAIIPFIAASAVVAGTSSRSDAPYGRRSHEGYLTIVERVLNHSTPSLVKLFCVPNGTR